MKRKIFAAFLSLMMVISMLPTSAFATEVDVPADCQHENAHWETVKEATCTVAGKEVKHCHDCEKDLEEREIPATGHAPKEEWVVVDESYVPADCEHAGHETYVCPNCDGQEEGGSETRDIKEDPALGHDWDEKNPVEKKEADCKNDGYTWAASAVMLPRRSLATRLTAPSMWSKWSLFATPPAPIRVLAGSTARSAEKTWDIP